MLKYLSILIVSLFLFLGASSAKAGTIGRAPNNLGLVGYWSFNDATSTARSTLVQDFSGQGNNGVMTNMANPATASSGVADGKLGKALSFDGSDDYVSMGDVLDFERTDPFTVSAWVNFRSLDANPQIVVKNNSATPFQGWGFDINVSQLRFSLINTVDASDLRVQSDTTLVTNTWYHVVTTYSGNSDATGVNFYINGAVTAKTTTVNTLTSTTLTAFPLQIGARDGATNLTDGLLDEVRIYNRALSAPEVQALYKSGAAKFTPPSNLGLVGYWSFNDATSTARSTLVQDFSGQGNNGEMINMANPATAVSGVANGRLGKALSFDGSDDYVSASINLVVPRITISFWLNWNAFANDADRAFELASGGNCDFSDDGLRIIPNSTGGTFDFTICENTPGKQTTAAITRPSAGVWHHYAVVMDRSKALGDVGPVYVDGVSQSITYTRDDDPGGNFAKDVLYFMSLAGTESFGAGQLDEVRVYNRALSADEVRSLYNSR